MDWLTLHLELIVKIVSAVCAAVSVLAATSVFRAAKKMQKPVYRADINEEKWSAVEKLFETSSLPNGR